ncbi:MAG: ABC transporter ATP-binding protein [Oscillospiraceae bacterium]|nr:ABC transporter ATP-binding protein [Oscillospiraceae bacterium]
MKKTLKKLAEYAAEYKGIIMRLVPAALLANMLALAGPYLSGRAIDFIAGENNVDFDAVRRYSVALIAAYLFSSVFLYVSTVLTNTLASKVIKDIRADAFAKISGLPLKFFDRTPHGDIISRFTNDTDAVSDGLLQGMTQFFSGIVTVLGSLVIMFTLNFKITLAVLAITVLCVFVSKFIAARSGKMFREQSRTIGELNGYIEEITENGEIINAFGYREEAIEKFTRINERLNKCGQKAQFYSSLVNPTTRFINNLAYISVGVFGGIAALHNNLSVGTISGFLIYATQFAKPINSMTGILAQLQSASASAERIFGLQKEESESDDSGLPDMPGGEGSVEFSNVSFSYTEDKPLIEDFSVRVKPGDIVAIVGPTGAGKTTVVNLLMRFYDTDRGGIFVNSARIDRVKRAGLRKCFAMVLQETWLFSGTIRENIAYSRADATDEEIENAAKAAYAHSFIKRMPDGYDTVINEDGSNLSQGQKQLLTIARAMLRDPDILILDEATSSVDTMTERRIRQAFAKMMKGRTSFVIAHRLSTIKDADTILVMKDGNIIEKGNHNELIEKSGFYAEMYKSSL